MAAPQQAGNSPGKQTGADCVEHPAKKIFDAPHNEVMAV
jgi:hypothetical protein